MDSSYLALLLWDVRGKKGGKRWLLRERGKNGDMGQPVAVAAATPVQDVSGSLPDNGFQPMVTWPASSWWFGQVLPGRKRSRRPGCVLSIILALGNDGALDIGKS